MATNSPSKAPSTAPEKVPAPPLSDTYADFNLALGPKHDPINNDLTDKQADERQKAILIDSDGTGPLTNKLDSVSEALGYSALARERNRTRVHNEYAKKKESGQKLTDEEKSNAIVIAQAETYHIYLTDAFYQIQDVIRRYQERKADGIHPSSLKQLKEGQISLYLQALTGAMNERVAFANVMLAMQRGKGAVSIKNIIARYPILSKESATALKSGDMYTMKVRMNELNHRMLSIMAGQEKIKGVDDGFIPHYQYLDLLWLEYKKTLEDQTELVRTGQEKEALVKDIAKGAEGDGNTLGDAMLKMYESARDFIKGNNEKIKKLGKHRKELTQELLLLSDYWTEYQGETLELVSIQKMFGKIQDPNAEGSKPDASPDIVRTAISDRMDERKEFHLGRLHAFSDSLEGKGGMLSVGAMEVIEHGSNNLLRPAVLRISQGLANIISYPFPGAAGDKVRNFLVGDLERAMGVPNKREGKWTKEERKEVADKVNSIWDAISEFDRTKIRDYEDTLDLITAMPPASIFLNQEISDPLPEGRVTKAEVSAVAKSTKAKPHPKGAEIMTRLFVQLEGDIGDVEKDPPTGLLGECKIFLKKVDKNIDVHIDVGNALQKQGRNYWLLALAAVGGAGVTYLLVRRAKNRWRRKYKKERKSKKKVDKKNTELEQKIQQKTDALAEAEAEAAKLRTEAGEAKTEAAKLRTEVDQAKLESQTDATKIADLEKAATAAETRANLAEQKAATAEIRAADAEMAMSEVQSELEAMRAANPTGETSAEGVKPVVEGPTDASIPNALDTKAKIADAEFDPKATDVDSQQRQDTDPNVNPKVEGIDPKL